VKKSIASIVPRCFPPSISQIRHSSALLPALFAAMAYLVFSIAPASAQTDYTWTSSTTGGTWTNSGNWTVTSGSGSTYPSASTDTATFGNATSNRIVTLTTAESISTLTFTQTSADTNEVQIGGSGTTALTLANALTVGGNSSGTEYIYLDGVDTGDTGVPKIYDAAGVTINANGVLEMSTTYAGTTAGVLGATSTLTPLTVQNGGILDLDLQTGSQAVTNSAQYTVVGNVTIGGTSASTGGILNMSSTNSGGVSSAGTSGNDTRFIITNGTLLMQSNSALNIDNSGKSTNEIYLNGTSTGATFDSGVTGLTGLNYIGWNGTAAGFTFASDVALPVLLERPTTVGTDNMTLETVTNPTTSTLSAAGIDVYGGAITEIPEITLGSNVTLTSIGIVPTHQGSGYPIIVNTSTFTLNVATGAGVFQTADQTAGTGVAWTLEGSGGTIEGTYINLANNTGTNASSTVDAGLTLLAIGNASTVETNNLGNATAGSLDATSTFAFQPTVTTVENYLTSNHTIGNLVVGNGANAATLGTSTAALTVGGGITVNASGVLDLDAEAVTESHGSDATAGGLSGGGTVLNGTSTTSGTTNSTTATLTLDTTDGNGSFSGVLEDHSSGTGTLALVVGGTGTQTISGGSNAYSGGTSVNAGTMWITNGSGTSALGTGALTVAAGATFGGSGTANGLASVAIGSGSSTKAQVVVGNGGTDSTSVLTLATSGTGSITTANLTFNLSASTDNQLNITTGSALSFSTGSSASTVTLNAVGGLTPGSYTLITDSAGFSGLTPTGGNNAITTGLSIASNSYFGMGDTYYGSYLYESGNSIDVMVAVAVPEPGTWAMMLGGLGLLLFWQRQRARAGRR
jgi:hypothetical protein